MGNIKKFLFFALIILTQCAWSWGWQQPEAPTSIYYPGVVATTNSTLSSAQTGNIIIFNNSTGVAANGTMFTLPAATVGLTYTIVADTAKFFYVKPASSDIINFSTNAANNRISNKTTAAIGDSVTLTCMTNGQWSIVNRVGTWTTEGN